MIFQHARFQIWSAIQHPYKHTLGDFLYANDALPGVTNVQSALNYIIAVLYPQSKTAVPTPADLPLVGNSINDMRAVEDDGDGKAAAYRWEQREGEASPSWHKIYDMDWGADSILQQFYLKTQDIYAVRGGYDDIDPDGNPITGLYAGQHIYGGRSANTNLTLSANSGDGTGAQTGYVQVTDTVRPTVDSSISLGTTSERWLKIWTDSATIDTMTLATGSITDSTGAISFDNENLSTTGTFASGTHTIGNMVIATGSITNSSGSISFDNENLSTTGTLASGTHTIGDMVIATGSITNATGTISFDNENLSTSGNISGAVGTFTQLDVDNVRIDLNTISTTNANGNLILSPNGTGVVDVQKAMTTLGQTITGDVGITGTETITGQLNVDNLRLDGNTLSVTNSNGNLIIAANGSGGIQLNANTYPGTTATYSLGLSSQLWTRLYLSAAISDGTNEISIANLLTFAAVGTPSIGDALFWDGSKWVASNPDTEIDHGELSGLADDDHTQYALLAGRTSGQTLNGGTASSGNLDLDSTSDSTKGAIRIKSNLVAFTNASYSGGWLGTDIGGSSNRLCHVYTAGEFFGFRLENVAVNPSFSSQTPGRLFYNTVDEDIYLDTGTAVKRVNYNRYEEDTVWDGSTLVKNVTVSDVDATKAIWQLKDNTNDYEVVYCKIQATSTTNVRITVGYELPAGSYRLIGLQ